MLESDDRTQYKKSLQKQKNKETDFFFHIFGPLEKYSQLFERSVSHLEKLAKIHRTLKKKKRKNNNNKNYHSILLDSILKNISCLNNVNS